MPTAAPQINSILDNVKTVLATITTTASYRNTVVTVNRQFLTAETLGGGAALPALLIGMESVDFACSGIGSTPKQTGKLAFQVQGILREYTNPSTEINDLAQDVREALYVSRSRGGYADNTHVSRVQCGGDVGGRFGEGFFVKKPFVGFLMDVEVMFHENL